MIIINAIRAKMKCAYIPDLKSGPSPSVPERNGADFDVQVRIRSGHGPGGARSHVVLGSTDSVTRMTTNFESDDRPWER